jgi:hypothetical protein
LCPWLERHGYSSNSTRHAMSEIVLFIKKISFRPHDAVGAICHPAYTGFGQDVGNSVKQQDFSVSPRRDRSHAQTTRGHIMRRARHTDALEAQPMGESRHQHVSA